MTAVASPPTFPQISRPAWGAGSGNTPMNPDPVRSMFAPRRGRITRTNRFSSSSSVSSNSSDTTVATNGSQANGTPLSASSDLSQWSANAADPRKRPPPKSHWPLAKGDMQPDLSRASVGRPGGMVTHHAPMQQAPGQSSVAQQAGMRALGPDQFPPRQPVLYLLSLNGTFERKTIAVPFAPDSLRIGRQTNQKTVPSPTNGFFDSKVLSRQHAEIYAERNGKVYIRDVKSSNGTFVNGTRLSQENRESEPHELQTADHLELGIDIVSEDQKTVVHHKVAAKVEHAGFLSNTNNVLDMNFGDLDPANGTMLVPNGPLQMRGRAGSNASAGVNGGRMVAGGGATASQNSAMAQHRPFFFSPIATEQILKRLANEMRNARLQAQDLNRTNQFVNTLLSKDDVKSLEKADMPEIPKPMANGSGVPFRSDAKNRFSDPPAPPPQQPLPEKPDAPSMKRGPSERPKMGPTSPASGRQENLSQIIQLTEALNNAKRDMEFQNVRVRELESMLQKERQARELAEDLARRFEESANSQMIMVGSVDGAALGPLEGVSEQASDASEEPDVDARYSDETEDARPQSTSALHSRIEMMDKQVRNLREQMEMWRRRCEAAETERDEGRQSLADMVGRLRAQEAKRGTTRLTKASPSRRGRSELRGDASGEAVAPPKLSRSDSETATDALSSSDDARGGSTATGSGDDAAQATAGAERVHYMQAGLPYASMLGVVLIGMSLMACFNGWQSPPPQLER
ncbi:hypothetical protein L249_0789 [Ophiocordyceps polyrhachis-furcata BCC 54312]|uniref:FHA domain-containing protein n=1 Tax=Ophiocordyceps polyrhachis-furcata BCC 54312 TaxID=1330021 RepID=A0A367LDK7_9HYPO|nr:hypothetical protein L249_0789 [Ophiocordyceps polyrhachis-furcata BCC 54312]